MLRAPTLAEIHDARRAYTEQEPRIGALINQMVPRRWRYWHSVTTPFHKPSHECECLIFPASIVGAN
jgi:hypothetical protein